MGGGGGGGQSSFPYLDDFFRPKKNLNKKKIEGKFGSFRKSVPFFNGRLPFFSFSPDLYFSLLRCSESPLVTLP